MIHFSRTRFLKSLTVAVAVAFASPAFAGSLNFDTRFDWDNVTYNADHANSALSGKSDFVMQTGRIDYKGNFNEDLSYRFRVRFNRDDHTVRNDSLSNEVDYAYIAHKLADGVTLTMGKFNSDLGGYDAMLPSSELYIKTRNYALIGDGNTYAGRRAYITGAKVTVGLGDHEINVFAADNRDGSNVPAQTRAMTGAVLKGNFMEKTLAAWVSYASEKANGATGSVASDLDTKANFMTLGAKYEVSDWFAALDLNSSTVGKVTVATVQNDYTLSSTALNAGYNMDKYTFKFVYEIADTTLAPVGGTTSKTTTNSLAIAAEFRPSNDKNFRYHVAYSTRSDKADTAGATTATENHLLAGIRLYADFLK